VIIMASKTTKKAPSKRKPTAGTVAETPAQLVPLSHFTNGGGTYEGFDFTRFWYAVPGPRVGIAEWVRAKLQVGDDPTFGNAVKHDVLPPDLAPGEYLNLEHLVTRYDEMLPKFEYNAFAHVKIALSSDEPHQIGWERVRAFSRQYFTLDRKLATILVLHAPGIACSSNTPHVHVIVPARQLGPNGFGETDRLLCTDPGQQAIWTAWEAWNEAYTAR
jgi:hypothetical protein